MSNDQNHNLFVITERHRFTGFNQHYQLIIGVGGFRNLLPIRQSNEPGLLSSKQAQALLYEVADTAGCNAASRGGSLTLSLSRRRQLARAEDIAVELVLKYLGWERNSINLTHSENHLDGFGDRFRELRDYWRKR